MFTKFERLIAFRYLRSKRREGFISVIAGFSLVGVALGVAALIIVMSVMNGFRAELMDKMLATGGHVIIQSSKGKLTDYQNMNEHILANSHVTASYPMIESEVLVSKDGHNIGAMARGIAKTDLLEKKIISSNIKTGSLDLFAGKDNIVLGEELAANLGVMPGDRLTLISPQTTRSIMGLMPRIKTYTVIATFAAGIYQYDSATVFMPLEAAQIYFNYPNAVNRIEIYTDNPEKTNVTIKSLYKELGKDLRYFDWRSADSHIFAALEIERTVMFLILTLIVLVAAFNIISGLIMLVKDKTRDIAILRTMGATRNMIMKIFFITGSAIGVVGTLVGMILGIAFSANIDRIKQGLEKMTGVKLFDPVIYYLSQLPSKILISDVVEVVLMALVLTFLATIYPAYKAAKLEPVEALKYE